MFAFSQTPAADGTAVILGNLPAELSSVRVILEPIPGVGGSPAIDDVIITDINDNTVPNQVSPASPSSFQPEVGETYTYTVTSSGEEVRVMEITGVNIGRIFADVPFEVIKHGSEVRICIFTHSFKGKSYTMEDAYCHFYKGNNFYDFFSSLYT